MHHTPNTNSRRYPNTLETSLHTTPFHPTPPRPPSAYGNAPCGTSPPAPHQPTGIRGTARITGENNKHSARHGQHTHTPHTMGLPGVTRERPSPAIAFLLSLSVQCCLGAVQLPRACIYAAPGRGAHGAGHRPASPRHRPGRSARPPVFPLPLPCPTLAAGPLSISRPSLPGHAASRSARIEIRRVGGCCAAVSVCVCVPPV